MEDDQVTLDEIIQEMDPVGRLHFDNAQLRVAVKRLQKELAELRNVQTSAAP